MKFRLFFLSVTLSAAAANGQGTLVYDQQSLVLTQGGEGSVFLSALQEGVQSFTPTLPGIDFASFWFLSVSQGSSFQVNVHRDSISGPLLGTSSVLAGAAPGPLMFSFPITVQLTPGTLYYLELVPVNGNAMISYGISGQSYPRGVGYVNGQPLSPDADFWFREGIVVPEPGTVSLLLLAAATLFYRSRRRCQHE